MKLKEILKYKNANGQPYACDLKTYDKYELQELLSDYQDEQHRHEKPSRA